NRASIFDPATSSFLQSQSMVDGRWYGTATALGDGRIMGFSGVGSTGNINTSVEIYDLRNAGAGWTSPISPPFGPGLYPRMLLLTDGTVFFTGQGDRSPTSTSYIFNPGTGSWTASASTT